MSKQETLASIGELALRKEELIRQCQQIDGQVNQLKLQLYVAEQGRNEVSKAPGIAQDGQTPATKDKHPKTVGSKGLDWPKTVDIGL